MAFDAVLEHWLRDFVSGQAGVAGSVHVREHSDEVLTLRASLNLPPQVVEVTRVIPKGKGMAGLAWERGASVATCNLKTDDTGDVRPGAKAVGARGAVAIPVRTATGEIRAVVGVAFDGERDFSPAELAALEAQASNLPASG